MNSEELWREFALEASENMRKFMKHELEYFEACEFANKYRNTNAIDEEILSFVTNVMSEIVPNIEMFELVQKMLGEPVTQQEFLDYMNTPCSPEDEVRSYGDRFRGEGL